MIASISRLCHQLAITNLLQPMHIVYNCNEYQLFTIAMNII